MNQINLESKTIDARMQNYESVAHLIDVMGNGLFLLFFAGIVILVLWIVGKDKGV